MLIWIYAIGWVITYWVDATAIHNMGYSFGWSIVCAIIDATIWPVRWGWDVVIHVLNKRGKK